MTDVTLKITVILPHSLAIFVQLFHACYNSLSLSRYNVSPRRIARSERHALAIAYVTPLLFRAARLPTRNPRRGCIKF